MGQLDAANDSLSEAVDIAEASELTPLRLYAQLGQAQLALHQGALMEAEKMVRMVAAHPSTFYYHRVEAQTLLGKVEGLKSGRVERLKG